MAIQWKVDDGSGQEEPKIDKFTKFLELFDYYIGGKTADPARLKLKVKQVWEQFTIEEKKSFTARLMAAGRLDPKVIFALEVFHGSINRFL